MIMTDLSVSSQEQTILLRDGYSAVLKFDMIYKRWFYNLYRQGTLIAAGVSLKPDTSPLIGMAKVSLGLIDLSDDKEEYEPFSELGSRLALMELAV